MPGKYNTHLIRSRLSYSITEISALFGIDRKTCSRWMREGLKPLKEGVSPLLIMGYDLKDFLLRKRAAKKVTLQENQFFCLKCRRAVRSKTGVEQNIDTGKTVGKRKEKIFKKTGICEVCGTRINRFIKVYHQD